MIIIHFLTRMKINETFLFQGFFSRNTQRIVPFETFPRTAIYFYVSFSLVRRACEIAKSKTNLHNNIPLSLLEFCSCGQSFALNYQGRHYKQ